MKRCRFEWVACGSCRHPEYMTNRKASLCPVNFPSYVGIIRHPDAGVMLFDTGYDPAFIEATHPFPERFYRWATPLTKGDTVIDALSARGLEAGDVTAIILSHFHGDHVAALHHFPHARIYCAKNGLGHLRGRSRFALTRQGMLPALIPAYIATRAHYFESCAPVMLPPAFSPFSHGADLLGDGSLLALELPGHCPGHWGLVLRNANDRYVFLLGDAVWSISAVEQQSPPPAITTAWLGNTASYRKTLASLHECFGTNRELVMLPSHCSQAARRVAESE